MPGVKYTSFMLFIFLTVTSGKTVKYMVTAELGKPINIRKTDLLGYFQESEASVFEPLPETCFIKKKIGYTGSIFDYYANIQAFYTKVAVGAGLDASLESSFSVGFYPQQCRGRSRFKRIHGEWSLFKHSRIDRKDLGEERLSS